MKQINTKYIEDNQDIFQGNKKLGQVNICLLCKKFNQEMTYQQFICCQCDDEYNVRCKTYLDNFIFYRLWDNGVCKELYIEWDGEYTEIVNDLHNEVLLFKGTRLVQKSNDTEDHKEGNFGKMIYEYIEQHPPQKDKIGRRLSN